jgi:alpha-L-rhamnosidase
MLLRQSAPSWLYQVVQGATTVWERWDAIRPDGSIHPGRMQQIDGDGSEPEGHMLSFNHYAYGAVIDWVYRHVAGVAPALPGYRRIRFAPRPHVSLSQARASIETPYGRTAIAWNLDASGSLVAEIDVPFGTSGIFSGAPTDRSRVTLDGMDAANDVDLGPGRHVIVVTEPHLAGATAVSPAL